MATKPKAHARKAVKRLPRRVRDIDTPASTLSANQIAQAYVRSITPQLALGESTLHFDRVKTSILGSHVLYQQYRGELPISGAWLRIDVSPDGRVFNVLNDLIPEPAKLRATKAKTIGARVADKRAREAVNAGTVRVVEHERVCYPVNGVPRSCWKVVVRTVKPRGAWKVYVDASSGSVVARFDLAKHVVGHGRVFDPNPISSLNDPTLTPTSVIPQQAYHDVDLNGLDGSGFLDGEFVSTRPTQDRTSSAANTFVFTRDDRAFREVMAYFHIDRVRRYLGDLGFGDVLNRAVEVNIDATQDEGSQYDPITKSILFASGGVPDAEDGEIIVHEYGHAIQDDQVPGFGQGAESRAMGEGFGDFLSASFFADAKSPEMRPMVGTWDAAGYPKPKPFLRRVDSTKKYPKDIKNNIYSDSAIWSASLWQMRERLGRATAEKLVIAHHHLLSPAATFEDAANALLKADQELNGGANAAAVKKIFTDRGILPRAKKKASGGLK
ncbi:MAG TPA: M36 family metallopeptidase [Thermoanaerobaculia bacterium]|nr:M36 family metallopeptidase [Thermoanaerobaculia bacterium]